jgi:feruloyl esterase
MKATVALAIAAPATALLVIACTSTTSQSTTSATDACSAQAQAFALPGVRVTEAVAVEGNSVRPPNVTSGPLLVAHCKLTGRMNERTGVDGKAYYIGFELRLPQQWNGRFLYQGGGGNDGVLRPAIGPQAAPGYALNRGFAVVATDAGHQGPDASFGFDPIARVDNAYHAHDVVTVTAKEIVKRFYAKPAERSYFIGCSGGGRQGMMFTQRFPSYFDGVIAMAPAMRVSKGATIAAAWDTQALAAIAPQGADRKPIVSQALSDTDLALLRKGILDACDAQDGIVDGLVSNPVACRFDPRKLMCEGGKTTECLTPLQVGALKKIFAGATDSGGRKLYFTWPWDPGIGHPQNDWRLWKLGTSTTAAPNSRHVVLMQDALQGYFVTPPDRSLTVLNFDFDRDPARLDAHAWIFNTADDVDLAGFRARGGKLLFAHGLADPIFSPDEMIDYYQRLSARHGAATGEFSRLFLIPGMAHCQGGAATDSWDGLGALMDWVEKGQPPQRIVATGTAVFPGRTRPMCPYPTYAHYSGGNAEDAASFSCRAP